jgi:GxxExxY protein
MSHSNDLEDIVRTVIDCGYHLHCDLGPGLLESAYELILSNLVERRGLAVRRQVPIQINYDGVVVDNAFRIDLLVEGKLLVELKSTERNSPVYAKQVLTYLRLMDLPLGLLMNFGQPTFKGGLQRVANNYFGPVQS